MIAVPAETMEGPPTFSRMAQAATPTAAAPKPATKPADGFQFGTGSGPEAEKWAGINAKLAAAVKSPAPGLAAAVPEYRFGDGSGAEAQKWAGVNAQLTAVITGKPAPAAKPKSQGFSLTGKQPLSRDKHHSGAL